MLSKARRQAPQAVLTLGRAFAHKSNSPLRKVLNVGGAIALEPAKGWGS